MTLDSTQLLASLRSEPAPVPFAKLKKAHVNRKAGVLESDLRSALEAGVSSGEIFAWPTKRYWHIDPETQLQSEILDQCAAKARKKAEIKVKGRAPKDVAAAVERLWKERKLLKYPALSGSAELFFRAGSRDAYWAYVREFVAAKLKKAGIEEATLEDKIWDLLPKLEAEKDVPVSTARVRRALGAAEVSKKEFDAAVLQLRDLRRVYLSQHDHPLALSAEDRDWLIEGKDGRYYVAITRRES
jgi:hypothetical protein